MIVVYWLEPTEFVDIDSGAVSTIPAPPRRAFELFLGRAAARYADYRRRRHGAENVWIEIDGDDPDEPEEGE